MLKWFICDTSCSVVQGNKSTMYLGKKLEPNASLYRHPLEVAAAEPILQGRSGKETAKCFEIFSNLSF